MAPISLEPPKKKFGFRWLLSSIGFLSILFITSKYLIDSNNLSNELNKLPPNPYKNFTKLIPTGSRAKEIINDPNYAKKSLNYFQGALKIPTEVFDDSERPENDINNWKFFLKFHEYLESSFPLTFSKLEVTKINKLGLIIEYPGSNKDLKPLVLTAHQDVVPVDESSLDRWIHPPFSAHYDGEFVWGRGAFDTKSLLISIFENFELLLESGYKLTRTIILSAGYDEESIGRYDGAVSLVKFLKEKYDSIYALVDEGGHLVNVPGAENRYIALPGVAEKGYIDVYFELSVEGGHSSVPFDHSAIGITGDLVHLIENDPYGAILTEDNPILDYLRTLGEIDEFEIDDDLRKSFLYAKYDESSRNDVLEYLAGSKSTKYLVRTSQAIDIIHAGVKINAIPEYLKLGINHRISLEKNVDDILNNLIDKAKEISEIFDLNLYLQNQTTILENDNSKGSFNISWIQPLNPSPISNTINDSAFQILSSTIKSVFEDIILPNSTVDIVPNLVGGYTDASRYHALGNNIYRFAGNVAEDGSGAHAVNEKFRFQAHLNQVAFLYDYILNVQEYDSF
ncbi:hypothetical protein WICMUC_004968 [Wickerhamomyces mucosus]|uniref:Peptidase M20 dimerisation domain-containing protein n=1 Tax=Wickerhamomyces mucosus TaxID=1378264 RepID=A0A9P8T911_9ASCO|nr:hypothetical protein WICMUC_004968 [Wickerhamomyces mucosus]